MNYTDQELEVFRVCIHLAEQGCKTDHELEKGVYKAIPWISPVESARLVKLWICERRKIDEILGQLKETHKDLVRHVEVHASQSTTECGGSSCASSQSL